MKRKRIYHSKECPGFTSDNSFCCNMHANEDRYRTYQEWRYFWHSGFLTIPIGRWDWWPKFVWDYWQRSFRWLWLTFEWNMSYHYEQKLEWEIQNKINTLQNQRLDNITLSQRQVYGLCADCGIMQPDEGSNHLHDCQYHDIEDCISCKALGGFVYDPSKVYGKFR